MNYSVITSNSARDELADIKLRHADLLTGIREQSVRRQAYDQQMGIQRQQQQQYQQDANQRLTETNQRQQELDIMRDKTIA